MSDMYFSSTIYNCKEGEEVSTRINGDIAKTFTSSNTSVAIAEIDKDLVALCSKCTIVKI